MTARALTRRDARDYSGRRICARYLRAPFVNSGGAAKSAMDVKLIRELEHFLPAGSVLSKPEDLMLYEYDGSVEVARPECIVFPRSTDDVVHILELSNHYQVPLVGRGAGTVLSGGALARQGGIMMVFSRMNRILEIDIENQRAVVQPGVVKFRSFTRCRIRRIVFRAGPFEPEGMHDRRKCCGKRRRAAHARVRRDREPCSRPSARAAHRRSRAHRR
jgi:hypothetical protein